MDAAPAWVTYTTLAIALFGAITGAGSLIIAYVTYRSAGHRVMASIKGLMVDQNRSGDVTIVVTVRNSGRGPVSISSFHLEFSGVSVYKFQLQPFLDELGKALPYRLEGGASAEWYINITYSLMHYRLAGITDRLLADATKEDVLLGVALGTGEVVSAKGLQPTLTMLREWLATAPSVELYMGWRKELSSSSDDRKARMKGDSARRDDQ